MPAGKRRGGVRRGVLSDAPFLVASLAFPVVGYLLASRRPENAITWLLAGVGVAFGMDTAPTSSTWRLR
jgi:hypothetical protein